MGSNHGVAGGQTPTSWRQVIEYDSRTGDLPAVDDTTSKSRRRERNVQARRGIALEAHFDSAGCSWQHDAVAGEPEPANFNRRLNGPRLKV